MLVGSTLVSQYDRLLQSAEQLMNTGLVGNLATRVSGRLLCVGLKLPLMAELSGIGKNLCRQRNCHKQFNFDTGYRSVPLYFLHKSLESYSG